MYGLVQFGWVATPSHLLPPCLGPPVQGLDVLRVHLERRGAVLHHRGEVAQLLVGGRPVLVEGGQVGRALLRAPLDGLCVALHRLGVAAALEVLVPLVLEGDGQLEGVRRLKGEKWKVEIQRCFKGCVWCRIKWTNHLNSTEFQTFNATRYLFHATKWITFNFQILFKIRCRGNKDVPFLLFLTKPCLKGIPRPLN